MTTEPEATEPETVTREDVEYVSEGSKIRGWFYPARGEGRSPAIVFCPGFTGTKFAGFYQPYVEHFVRQGWSVLLSDYQGWGESEGPWGEIVPARQVADIRAGLGYLESRPDVDAQALSLFGVSFGGGNAVYAAGLDDRVCCCIVVSPVSDGEQWLHEMRREYEWQEFLGEIRADERDRIAGLPGRMVAAGDGIMIPTPEKRTTTIKGDVPAEMVPDRTPLRSARDIMEFRPADVAHRIAPGALLVFCVSRDPTVPASHGRRIFERAREPKELVTIDGSSHYGTYIKHFSTISEASTEWLKAHGVRQGIRVDPPNRN